MSVVKNIGLWLLLPLYLPIIIAIKVIDKLIEVRM